MHYVKAALMIAFLFIATKFIFKYFTTRTKINKYVAFAISLFLSLFITGIGMKIFLSNPPAPVASPVQVITSLHESSGLSEKDYDLSMLKSDEKDAIKMIGQQIRQHIISSGHDPNEYKIDLDSESHFTTIEGKKLGFINISISAGKKDDPYVVKAIRIIGFTSKGVEVVNCIRQSKDEIPMFAGNCGEKIRNIFGVALPK